MPRNLPAHQASKARHKISPMTLSIAIIVRTKNRPQLLVRSLQSLVEQKRIPDEVIVVNDGGVSVENVVNDCSGLNIRLLNNATSQGRAKAGNQGVQAANSDAIGFLDDDDRFLPDHLQRLEKAMLHFDAKVTYSGCRLLQRDMLGNKIILQEQMIGQHNDPFDAKRLHYENYIPLINLLIDRTLWLTVGGFDEKFDVFEDWDVLLRLATHTSFYHIDRITAEYAIWGKSQKTQASDQQQWREAYRQFLEKHLISLSKPEQLEYLAEYWRVSQERRGIVQETTVEKQALQLQLLQNDQNLEQLQHQVTQYQTQNQQLQSQNTQLQSDWTTKYEQLQSDFAKQIAQLQSDWSTKYERLQSENAQLHSDWISKYQQLQADYTKLQSDWTVKYQQLQSESTQELTRSQSEWRKKYDLLQTDANKQQAKMQAVFEELEKSYSELQTAAQQEYDRYQSQQGTLHELSQQIAVGLKTTTIDNVCQSQSGAYAFAVSSGNVSDDYQRLVNWIREKAEFVGELERNLATQIQPLRTEYQNLRQQLAGLIQLISASHWPQIRRYAKAVQEIDKKLEGLFLQTEHYMATSTGMVAKTGLNAVTKHEQASEIPPARPLSNVYPTFTSFAGTPENPQIMESVNELGTVPFLLDPGVALVFTVHCTLDDFCRLDILLATRLRINTCQVRIILRDLKTKEPVRVLYLEALELFDNRFQSISFAPMTDSAGKTYQIEMDSPDANEQSGMAVWCHATHPPTYCAQQLSELTTQRFPQTLPYWVQQSLLDLALPAQLGTDSAPMIFMVWGITESTPVLNLQIFLRRLSNALTQADSTGKVVICGQLNQELQQYCQQHQLTTLDNTQAGIELSTVLDWGKTQAAEYLWCCDINAIAQPDIIERAIEILSTCSNAGMLVPVEKYSDGTIRAGYASLVRDGLLQTTSVGSPADHPYYGYRRTIEAASSPLVILKIAGLSQLDGHEVSVYHTPMYQLTELIWQWKQHQYETFYEGALCYEHDQPYPEFTEQEYTEDNQRFYQRWKDMLPTDTAPFIHLSDLLNPLKQPTVLVIDATLPMYDEDSGSLRLFTLLKIWLSLGYRITFFPDNLDSQFKYRHALEALGIEVFHSGYDIQSAMAYRQFDFAFICRVDIGHRYIPFIRLLSPDVVIFYDTVDIHYIREQRQAEIENNPQLTAHAQTTKRHELSNCLLANRVITVTEEDANHLQQELPNLTCSVIPNIHPLQPLPETNIEQREGLVFIGNYNHKPNQDAVYSFIETVLPKIQARLPAVCFYLIGSNMNENLKTLANEHVKIIGWVDLVEPEFAKRRVFVSYLRYGAGMKGKLGQALSLGLPIVTTTIGAEGMGLVEEKTALIADDSDHFAEAVCRLYTDTQLWEKLSSQGRDYIEHHYGETAVRDRLQNLLANYQ